MRSLQRHDVILKLPSDINESMLTFLTCFDILLIDSTKLINCNVILRRDLDKCILVAVSLTEMLIVKLRNIGKTWRVTTDDAIWVSIPKFDISESHTGCVEKYHSPV